MELCTHPHHFTHKGAFPMRRSNRRIVFALLAALAVGAAAPDARASDGVLEINETCAVQTGCFSGDTALYPVTIDGSAGRSYRLTGDLVVPENTDGILITTHDVGIDLNDFTIIGAACVGATDSSCRPTSFTGTGVGVDVGNLRFGISVRNGSITGMGRDGVFLGNQAEVTDLRLRWNGSRGIDARLAATISRNTVYQNGAFGIIVGGNCTVSGNTTYQNVLIGIAVGNGCTVSGNTTYLNGDHGIFAVVGSTVSGNTAYQNGDDGIQAGTDCLVQRNIVRGNGSFGLRLDDATAYRENVINDTTAGTVINRGGTGPGGVNMFTNSCNGTTTCP